MKRFSVLLIFALLLSGRLFATHNIAGEITYTCLGPLHYGITVTTYTNSGSPADRCELRVYFGDGQSAIAPRINGPASTVCPGEFDGESLVGYPSTKINHYYVEHIYSGAAIYTVHITDPNRIAGIDNIPNSVNVPFYLQSVIYCFPTIGCNSSPQLTTIPLDKACVGHCFYHNPGATDADGDSLSYAIGPCLADSTGDSIVGYQRPPININPVTGDMSWCSPTAQGKFNVCVYVYQWYRFANSGSPIMIGYVLRDMEIDVSTCNDNNPDIPDLNDICVIAGTVLNFNVVATDPDNDNIELTAYGSPFQASPAATFSAPSGFAPQPVTGTFNWNTSCDNVRLQPYFVTYKARDDYSTTLHLLDIESMNITVVSPGPPTLTATPQASSMHISWSVNPCDPVNNHCIGYRIYRRNGPSGWNPANCETGVPAYTGFQLIGTVTGLNNLNFVDDNGGAGLVPGVDYCYRVHAFFIDGAMSLASPEACNELKRDVPIITHADIENPTPVTNDTVTVRWANALAVDLDTNQHPGPYILKLYRAQGLNYSGASLIATMTSTYFTGMPSSYVDHGFNPNLATTGYCYRLSFFAGNGSDSIGITQAASTIFVTPTPSDNAVTLSWIANVPWTNHRYAIFRRDNQNPNNWDSIANVFAPLTSYKDSNLVNGVDYCYYVRAVGSYSNPSFPDSLFNRSQRVCATPQDMTPPCPPTLAINSDCYNFINQLIWTNPISMGCADDVVGYNIYYSATDSGQLTLLYTYNDPNDTNHTFGNLPSVAGCYAITAFDTVHNESALSNIICVDNCPNYELPNVFTPDGDGTNDELVAFPWRSVKDVDFKIFDRWGVLVYQTTDPDIHWNGRNMGTNKLCTDGVYFYVCTVDEIRLQGIVPRQLKGFVHLFGSPTKHE